MVTEKEATKKALYAVELNEKINTAQKLANPAPARAGADSGTE